MQHSSRHCFANCGPFWGCAACIAFVVLVIACPYYLASALVSLPGECSFATVEDTHRKCCGLVGDYGLDRIKTDRDCVWFWPSNCEWYGYSDAPSVSNASAFSELENDSTCHPHLVYWDVNSPSPASHGYHGGDRFPCYSDMLSIARLWNPTTLAAGIGAATGFVFALCSILAYCDPDCSKTDCCKYGWWIVLGALWLVTSLVVIGIAWDQIQRGEKTTALKPHFSVDRSTSPDSCTLRFSMVTGNHTSDLAYLMAGLYLPPSFSVEAWRSPVVWTHLDGVEFTTYNPIIILAVGLCMLFGPFVLLALGFVISQASDRTREWSFYSLMRN